MKDSNNINWPAVVTMAIAQILGLILSAYLAWTASTAFSGLMSAVIFIVLLPVIGSIICLTIYAIVFGVFVMLKRS